LSFELELFNVKVKQQTKYLYQRSFHSSYCLDSCAYSKPILSEPQRWSI